MGLFEEGLMNTLTYILLVVLLLLLEDLDSSSVNSF